MTEEHNHHSQGLKQPRIIGIAKDQKSLLDYNESGHYTPYRRETPLFYKQAKLLFTDHEIKLLVIWAIISPSAALAYLIWTKYEKLRLLSILLFAVSVVQFIVQWQGVYALVQRFLNP